MLILDLRVLSGFDETQRIRDRVFSDLQVFGVHPKPWVLDVLWNLLF